MTFWPLIEKPKPELTNTSSFSRAESSRVFVILTAIFVIGRYWAVVFGIVIFGSPALSFPGAAVAIGAWPQAAFRTLELGPKRVSPKFV